MAREPDVVARASVAVTAIAGLAAAAIAWSTPTPRSVEHRHHHVHAHTWQSGTTRPWEAVRVNIHPEPPVAGSGATPTPARPAPPFERAGSTGEDWTTTDMHEARPEPLEGNG